MVDFCHLNQSKCLNNGECIVNILLNTSYCQCDPCHQGNICEDNVHEQMRFDKDYIYFIIFTIAFGFSLLNNSMSLELFIRCSRIRRTNCGIYLIVYSILSLLSSIVLLADGIKSHYRKELDIGRHIEFRCYLTYLGYPMLAFLNIWFSAFIAFERGLIIYCGSKMNATRRRSCITTVSMLLIAGASVTPLLYYKCDWRNMPNLKIWYIFVIYFYLPLGIIIYLLASVFVLIGLARRIRRYGTENGSCIKNIS